jgi:hypothetical protein
MLLTESFDHADGHDAPLEVDGGNQILRSRD